MARIEDLYGENDLCSLLGQYADRARRAVGRKIRFPDFFSAVHETVIPLRMTDPEQIAATLLSRRKSYAFREICCFYDYAAVWALIALDVPYRSDRELCATVEYLKALNDIEADELFFRLSEAERILSSSPYFSGSDDATKNSCRNRVAEYARRFSLTEEEAARILCAGNPLRNKKSRAAPFYFPLLGVVTLLLLLPAFFLTGKNLLFTLFLVLPLSETAKQMADAFFSRTVRTESLPRLKLSAVPDEGKTLCVITALLTGGKEDLSLVDKIRNCCFSNRGKNVLFGLLCDLKEADAAECASDGETVSPVKEALEELNRKYGLGLFFLLRSRRFCSTEGKFMGWERKRGAVIELTRFLKGKPTTLSVLTGNAEELSDIRYVITLDSDTRLYRGAVCDMVGAMLHPANRPVIEGNLVKEGHAILQPRMEPSLASAGKTPFSVLMSGSGGTDIYSGASYETYQSLFGEGIFCGKGIFDLDAFSLLIDGKFPDETVLSHDLLEGTRLRAGALTDLSLTDSLPKNPLSYLDRMHRWIRGDVQALLFTGKYVPDSEGKLYPNPISTLSRRKILDNVRRALVPVFSALALLLSTFLPEPFGAAAEVLALLPLLFPCLLSVFFLIKSAGRRFFSHVMPGVLHALGNLLYASASLLQTAIFSADAVFRAGFRMLFSQKHLLEWKTASEAEKGISGLPLFLYRMLPSLLIGAALLLLAPQPRMKLFGLLFFSFPFAAWRMGKEFSPAPRVGKGEKEQITAYARDIWKFFSERVGPADSYLPPDNIQLSPAETVAHRTSPTNIGLYLLCCAAARDFGFIGTPEMLSRLKKALASLEKMQKWNGHLYNWYNTETLDLLGAPYVSTVDSGNFVTCLVALDAALSELDDGTPRFGELRQSLRSLIEGADFSLLYDRKKKLFRIGINTANGEGGESSYDLFMSEARTTSYFAIATGQVPREHWNRLGRHLILKDGYLGLASWTGTAFEYLMPALLLPTRFGSLSYEALSFALREQKAASVRGVWGRSESGYFLFDADMNYQYKAFGAPSLGMKRGLEKERVIAPYASFLCLSQATGAALENLEKLKDFGMYGRYGFYEAIDFTPSRVGKGHAVIRSYMAHHAGMSLIAAANACFGGIFVRRFLSDPVMASSEELLEEKIPINAPVPKSFRKGRTLRSHPLSRNQLLRLSEPDGKPDPSLPTVALLSDSGVSVTGGMGMLKFSALGADLAVDPFLFGEIHRPRLLFSADGKIYDALSGTMSRGAAQSRLLFRLDEKELMADVTVTVSGRHRGIVLTLEVTGRFSEICPLFCFEPSLCPSREREAHPAYADLLVRAEYLEDEAALLYTRRQKDSTSPDLCLAVSLEGHGGKQSFETRRDLLGLMYGEKEIRGLFDASFSCRDGALVNPFCALKRESRSRGGKYIGNILLCAGAGRAEALSSLLDARRELREKRRKNAAAYFSSFTARAVAERLSVCGRVGDFSRFTELLLSCSVRRKGARSVGKSYPIGALYRHGISGDLPIFCLKINRPLTEGSPVRKLVTGFVAAHKYLTLSGLRSDLVLLYKSDGEYGGRQRQALGEICDLCADAFLLGHSGGIFLLDDPEETPLFGAVSLLYAELDGESTLEGIRAEYLRPRRPLPPIAVRPTVGEVGEACDKRAPGQDLAQEANPEDPSGKQIPRGESAAHGGENTTPGGEKASSPSDRDLPVTGGLFTERGFKIFKGSQKAPWSYVYACRHFGTLLTQNSLGYSWIGNSHERRITPFSGDNLLDFGGERLILRGGEKEYDLIACSHTVLFGKGAAEYLGEAAGISYTVTVTVDPLLPCKTVFLTLPESAEVEYRVLPVMGERPRPSRPVSRVRDGEVLCFLPRVTESSRYDIGFLCERHFGSCRAFLLGAYPVGGEATLRTILDKYSSKEAFLAAGPAYEKAISSFLPRLRPHLPDPFLSVMTGYYLPYQALVCRLFGRTGFFQSGGAYGFRDQLQDCLCLLGSAPALVRSHLLRCASHQYEEGDVMHWWHTVHGVSRGVRTRCSDDLLWLPFVTAEYILATGDSGILSVSLPYLASPPLSEKEGDRYEEGRKSRYRESLYSHCLRAIDRALRFGKHGLPLIDGGDWNDGMNCVGEGGGESVWLGLFLTAVLERFLPLAVGEGDVGGAEKYREVLRHLKAATEKSFAEGRYLRAYYGDGTPLGGGEEIDLLPQAFAALTGGEPDRAREALTLAASRLFDRPHRLFRLLSPPFERNGSHDPGYISSYPAGMRENGGQYTHAAVWAAMGCASVGLNTLAADILRTLNPAALAANPTDARRYGGEPYFVAGDVSASPAFPGRCGWSLYTGAAGWFFLAVVGSLMGFRFFSDRFTVTPCLSSSFPSFDVTFTVRQTEYTVRASLGVETSYRLDGKIVNNLFYFDKNSHLLEITVEISPEMK